MYKKQNRSCFVKELRSEFQCDENIRETGLLGELDSEDKSFTVGTRHLSLKTSLKTKLKIQTGGIDLTAHGRTLEQVRFSLHSIYPHNTNL